VSRAALFCSPWLATLVPRFALERRIGYAQFITLLSLNLGKEGRKAGGAVKPLSLTSPVQHKWAIITRGVTVCERRAREVFEKIGHIEPIYTNKEKLYSTKRHRCMG
jgi:hypothetical protein